MNRKQRTAVIVTNLVWGFLRRWLAMKGQVIFAGLALLALGWAPSRSEWRRPAGWEIPPAGPAYVTAPTSHGPGNGGRLADDLPSDRLCPGAGETPTPATLRQGEKPVNDLAAERVPDPDEPSTAKALGTGRRFGYGLSPDHPGPGAGEAPTPAILGEGGSLPVPTAAPVVITPPPHRKVVTYTVQEGDTVWDIAQRFRISSDTIIWANEWLELDPDFLSTGQELIIPPVSGVLHTVRPGNTLTSIAKRYGVSIETIVAYEANHLQKPDILIPGQRIIVPGGRKPFEPRLVYTEKGPITVNAQPEAGRFIGPAGGYLTQYFSRRHPAIDLANAEGTPVRAADAGQVALAGWAAGLGNAVFLDHGNGYVTRYGHLKSYAVEKGQQVERGQVIGKMGNTGKSTGPHLHFTIQYLGGAVNPIRYLPPTGR